MRRTDIAALPHYYPTTPTAPRTTPHTAYHTHARTFTACERRCALYTPTWILPYWKAAMFAILTTKYGLDYVYAARPCGTAPRAAAAADIRSGAQLLSGQLMAFYRHTRGLGLPPLPTTHCISYCYTFLVCDVMLAVLFCLWLVLMDNFAGAAAPHSLVPLYGQNHLLYIAFKSFAFTTTHLHTLPGAGAGPAPGTHSHPTSLPEG